MRQPIRWRVREAERRAVGDDDRHRDLGQAPRQSPSARLPKQIEEHAMRLQKANPDLRMSRLNAEERARLEYRRAFLTGRPRQQAPSRAALPELASPEGETPPFRLAARRGGGWRRRRRGGLSARAVEALRSSWSTRGPKTSVRATGRALPAIWVVARPRAAVGAPHVRPRVGIPGLEELHANNPASRWLCVSGAFNAGEAVYGCVWGRYF